MTYSLACCGCGNVMDVDGKASIPFMHGGVLRPVSPELLPRVYGASVEALESFAVAHGWKVELDGGRANHRCPNCLEDKSDRRGAIVDARRGVEVENAGR